MNNSMHICQIGDIIDQLKAYDTYEVGMGLTPHINVKSIERYYFEIMQYLCTESVKDIDKVYQGKP
jgi:hypothetical protein